MKHTYVHKQEQLLQNVSSAVVYTIHKCSQQTLEMQLLPSGTRGQAWLQLRDTQIHKLAP